MRRARTVRAGGGDGDVGGRQGFFPEDMDAACCVLTYLVEGMLTAADIARHPGPLAFCTACDFPFARVLERAGVDVILVGDSLANVALGLHSTRGVGMAEMELFAA